jgi:hypothetical protein
MIFISGNIRKLHIQKYDGLENIENPNRTLEVTLGSNTDTNLAVLGLINQKKLKKTFRIAFSREVVGPDSFNIIFTSARRGRHGNVVKTKIGQDPMRNTFLYTMVQY